MDYRPLKILFILFFMVLGWLGAVELTAQEPAASDAAAPDMAAMMEAWMKGATPGDEHAAIAKSAGTWKATVKAWTAPGAEPMVSEGIFKRQMMLGGRVLEENYESNMMGMPFNGHSLLGFDNVSGRWWTIWVDNMSTGPMIMWGDWDEQEKAYVYTGQTPDPVRGRLIEMKTIVRHVSDDEEKLEMYDMTGGEAIKTMEIVAVRQ